MKLTCDFCDRPACFWITSTAPSVPAHSLCAKHVDMVEVVAC